MDQDRIVAGVLGSAKYGAVDRRVVERIVASCVGRYGSKRAEDEARRLLHQIWGIYYADPKFAKHTTDDRERLLSLHQSTKERLPILSQFYERMFAVTGKPAVIVDWACGLNPLAFTTLGVDFPARYHAFDIDLFTVDTLNAQFAELGLQGIFRADIGDLLVEQPLDADVILLLKVLPCLELQQKGSGVSVLERQTAEHLVVSYPLQSVSGREKGMLDFYRQQFREMTQGKRWQVVELVFANELVYVIKKGETQRRAS